MRRSTLSLSIKKQNYSGIGGLDCIPLASKCLLRRGILDFKQFLWNLYWSQGLVDYVSNAHLQQNWFFTCTCCIDISGFTCIYPTCQPHVSARNYFSRYLYVNKCTIRHAIWYQRSLLPCKHKNCNIDLFW